MPARVRIPRVARAGASSIPQRSRPGWSVEEREDHVSGVLGPTTAVGADDVIVDTEGRFAEDALRPTDGEGVHVVYDGSGPTTFQGSLDVLHRSGTFCWYGPVLGGPGLLDIMSLPKSIKIGYAVSSDHIPTPELLRAHTTQLFDWIADGKLKVRIGGEYPLADAAKAHADMESRKTTGKLLPGAMNIGALHPSG